MGSEAGTLPYSRRRTSASSASGRCASSTASVPPNELSHLLISRSRFEKKIRM
jgi:hypothetical protein